MPWSDSLKLYEPADDPEVHWSLDFIVDDWHVRTPKTIEVYRLLEQLSQTGQPEVMEQIFRCSSTEVGRGTCQKGDCSPIDISNGSTTWECDIQHLQYLADCMLESYQWPSVEK